MFDGIQVRGLGWPIDALCLSDGCDVIILKVPVSFTRTAVTFRLWKKVLRRNASVSYSPGSVHRMLRREETALTARARFLMG